MANLPHSRDCFVCGERNPEGFRLKFELGDENHVFLRFRPRDSMQGYASVMHGGLQATLLDETMGWAAAVAMKRMNVAAELTFRYLKSTPLEKELVVEAWPTKVNARLGQAEGIIRDHDGTIYTRGFGKFRPLSQEESKYVDSQLIYHEGDARIFAEP